ncbi:MAG: hypothetical protein HY898_34670 [Deltaproteobacteria bacterium]|nr:hypothetical protein [Deltaproteobacteria bacterium]
MQTWRSRSLLISLLAVGYVAFAALRESAGGGSGWVSLAILPALLWIAWVKTAPPPRGLDPVDPITRRAARVGATGAALVAAAWTGPPDRAMLDTAANLGVAMASIAALVALARISPTPGLLQPPAATRRMDAVVLAGLLWGIGVVVPAARLFAPERTTLLDPLAINYATAAASTGAIGLIVAAAGRVRAMRRLELGVADRAAGALALSVVVLALAIPCALLQVAPPDRVMSAGAVVASSVVFFACVSREPTGVARTMRTVLAIVLLGAPVVLVGIAASTRIRGFAGLGILLVAAASALVGLMARALATPLGPARSRWLEAINRANEAALHPDPDIAVRDALATVRQILPGETASPALFRSSPAEVLTIDRAGYLHTVAGEAPAHLYEIADGEPERTVRTEVLQSLQVRRADLRPLLSWLEGRGLLAVTLVRDEDGPVGLIGIPKGSRRAPMNLEEVLALRVLADRVGAILGVSSALARSRAREMDLRKLADRRGDEMDRLKHRLATEAIRHKAVVERLAHPASAAAYSPAAQVALEQCRRLGGLGIPLTLLTPPGIDPVPWASVAHLASQRNERPFVIVAGDDPAHHDVARWRDASLSPLVLASGGTLLLLDLPALPRAVQEFVAASLAERVSPSGAAMPLDLAISVSVNATIDALVAAGRVAVALADWLGDRAVPLPTLASRSEDIRALTLDHLARLGVRLRGTPLGVDDGALKQLLEHGWPGNDVEFADVMLRASLVCQGPRVTDEDLRAIGFGNSAGSETESTRQERRSTRPPSRRTRG